MTDNRYNIDPEELIARVLSGNGTEEDTIALDKWRAESEANDKLFVRYRSIWGLTGKMSLSYPAIDLDKEFNHFRKRTLSAGYSPSGRRVIPLLAKLASAAVLLALIGLTTLMVIRQNEYTTLKAESVVAQYTLPDGSDVSLYPGSKIKYKPDFGVINREVDLSGEAFFEVKRDSAKPFIVIAGELSAEVLGTSFNVKNNRAEKEMWVIVEEGLVAVFEPGGKSKREILAAGEMILKERGKSSITRSQNTDPNINAWKSKKLLFVESPIEEVCKTLSKVYQVNIICETADPSLVLTTTFDGNDLGYILATIEATLDLKAEYAKKDLILLK